MRTWTSTFLKLLWGAYLVLTSLYCLLAFLPYTYFALIKAPAYSWMPWFVHHQAILYWAALLAVAAGGLGKQSRLRRPVLAGLALLGLYITARPFMAGLQNTWTAYWWSLAALAPLLLTSVLDAARHWPSRQEKQPDTALFGYSGAVLVAIAAALLYSAGAALQTYFEKHAWTLRASTLELIGWSLISHILVAIVVLSVVNLVRMAGRRTPHPRSFETALIGSLVFAGLWMLLVRFLNSALSFEGWASHLYAASLSAALSLFAASLVLPFLAKPAEASPRRKLLPAVVAIAVSCLAVALPTLIVGGDWNGVLQHSFALIFWLTLSVCVYSLHPWKASYSVAGVLAVLVLSGFAYKGLQATEIFWARPLGSTDDDVARALERYASHDASFLLAHYALGNSRQLPCGDLCRIMRQYTNIRDAQARVDVNLVDQLAPTTGDRPNIFLLVIDSLRPDYLGAYNPKVDFTPNLDSFARDSIAVRNVYTQYAGTTLSEPAIWAGAMLLHAHYLQPFHRVNSLEKLANADGYQMVVSYDTVLSQILSPADDLIKLDTDKPLWNRFEVCSTVQQTEAALDSRRDPGRPVFFYAQPMNVHQFASNDNPRMTSANWRIRPGFQNRIAYEVHQVDACLGNFFSYLKARGLYENSIIIVTSDHGDATGEFGRYSHSISIYPEVMRVPLLVHLPEKMRSRVVYDDSRLSALTDIAPSLYYLLGHRPVRPNPMFGHPLFVADKKELDQYHRDELFLASDERAVYGLLADGGRFLYTTYDYPAESFLFDLQQDPNAEHSILTAPLKQEYDERLIQYLHLVADFYGYKPGMGTLLAAAQ